jgi:hypothetical protein
MRGINTVLVNESAVHVSLLHAARWKFLSPPLRNSGGVCARRHRFSSSILAVYRFAKPSPLKALLLSFALSWLVRSYVGLLLVRILNKSQKIPSDSPAPFVLTRLYKRVRNRILVFGRPHAFRWFDRTSSLALLSALRRRPSRSSRQSCSKCYRLTSALPRALAVRPRGSPRMVLLSLHHSLT